MHFLTLIILKFKALSCTNSLTHCKIKKSDNSMNLNIKQESWNNWYHTENLKYSMLAYINIAITVQFFDTKK